MASLHRAKTLRKGLNVTHGADILWTLNHPDVWLGPVEGRGWSPQRFEKWPADTSCAQLLEPASAAR